MEKIRKYMLYVLIAIIAIGSSISYLKKGDFVIETGVSNVQNEIIEKVVENPGTAQQNKVNLNTASIEELQIAPGIGETKAKAIIEYRNKYGNFSSVDELIEVSGIGDKTLAKIRDYYTVE